MVVELLAKVDFLVDVVVESARKLLTKFCRAMIGIDGVGGMTY